MPFHPSGYRKSLLNGAVNRLAAGIKTQVSSDTNNDRRAAIKINRICVVRSIFKLCSEGKLKEAVDSLDLLVERGIRLDSHTLAFLVQQCTLNKSLAQGRWIHIHIKLTRIKPTVALTNDIINMYAKCGSLRDARKLFDKMHVRNVYSWNTMLAGYSKLGLIAPARQLFDKMSERDMVSWNTMIVSLAQNGMCEEAIQFYSELRSSAIGFNEFSFAGVLIACKKLLDLEFVRQIHSQVLVAGFLSNLIISSSLVDAYAKSGVLEDAHQLFDEMPLRDVQSWTTMVSAYARSGNLEAAHGLFDEMPEKNAVSWTAMVSGYARHNRGPEALKLFAEMQTNGIKPDQFTFSSSLWACSGISALEHGKQIHAHLIRTGFRPNTIVISALIDMYSKCGRLESGRIVFDGTSKLDIVLWNTMIGAFAHHGHGREAIRLFEELVRSGMKPDRITFIVTLTACSHTGLVLEGLQFFESMNKDHSIVPDQEHYACLFDLLGRAGRFDKVMEWLEKMPCKPDSRIWNALLSASRIHCNIELGIISAENLLELEPRSSASYVLLSNIYAQVGRWDCVEKVRRLMRERQVRKELAISWIKVEGGVHSFTVADQLHPLKEKIYKISEQLANQVVEDVWILDDTFIILDHVS